MYLVYTEPEFHSFSRGQNHVLLSATIYNALMANFFIILIVFIVCDVDRDYGQLMRIQL